MKTLQTKKCETCGEILEKGYFVSQKKWNTMRFCCFSCRRFSAETIKQISETKKNSPTTVRGESHHNWKGGVTIEHNKARNSAVYLQWRNSVYKKDNWTCQDCGIHCGKGNIVAHHLISFADKLEFRYVVENGQVLCRPCHARVHAEERSLARAIKISQISYITHV